eukprot:Phypoly_transcript_13086.p1 GENE.Phypoly_transcript_13086~~Phypoly_transcript_13086.p1  ORF type:complete len:280 (+),score=45.36 Phypoly_transcript_13086:61-840(+)
MAQELDQTNVFVKYLPAELEDAGLKDLFAPYGDIISSKVMVDHQTGSSLGYGFVRFATPEEAQQAILKLSGQRVGSKVLLCKLSNSSPNIVTPELSTNLYIKPLLPSTTEESLREIFAKFGPIAALKVMVDKVTGESKQIGFVRYENQEDATAALNAMHGKKLASDQPTLIVKYAETEIQRIVRKSRGQSSPYPQPPSPPPSPTYYYSPSLVYTPVQYMPFSIGPYNHYMLSYHPQQAAQYSTVWRPPYVLAAEQAISY